MEKEGRFDGGRWLFGSKCVPFSPNLGKISTIVNKGEGGERNW